MTQSDVDVSVLVNLRVLAQLQEHDKLNCSGTYFVIERGFLTAFYRYTRNETREKTISRVSDTLQSAESRNIDIREACRGLVTLRNSTYADCPTTCARLDTIISRARAAAVSPNANSLSHHSESCQSTEFVAAATQTDSSPDLASHSTHAF